MKFLDKLGLALFSAIVLTLAIIVCLISFGWVDVSILPVALTNLLSSQNGTYICIGVAVVIALLAVKCLFFPSYDKHQNSSSDEEDGILLQNDTGKLLITKGTIKNIVISTVNEFKDIEGTNIDVEIDTDNNVYVNLAVNVNKGTIIKDISTKLQNKIKDTVKKATDLDIKEINIKVSDIEKEERTEDKEEEK